MARSRFRQLGITTALFSASWLTGAYALPAGAIEQCGEHGPVPGMTIGELRIKQQPAIISSAEAIAAVVRTSTVVPVAWIVWDQTATPWIALKPDSPHILARLVRAEADLRNSHFIASGKNSAGMYGIYSREVVLPRGYELLACAWIH